MTATCPAGTIVIGGGGQVTDETNAFVNDTFPGWSVDYINDGTSASNATTTAICAPAAATAP